MGSSRVLGIQTGLTRVVGQAACLAVKAEPPLPPGLDTATHLHQGSAAAAPGHADVSAVFRVVTPAFQVLPEIQDPGAQRARWGRGRGLRMEEKGAADVKGRGGVLQPAAPRRASQTEQLMWKVASL